MWPYCQNLRATQKVSHSQNKQMTAVGYIADTEEIIKASLILIQHDGVAPLKFSERSPVPPALSAKNLPRGWTQILTVCWIRRINNQQVKCDDGGAHDSISDTKNWLNWNCDWENPKDSKDNWVADIEYHIKQDIEIN